MPKNKWCTIAPVDRLWHYSGDFHLAKCVRLTSIPDWFRKTDFFGDFVHPGKKAMFNTQGALIVEYEAESLGDQDPIWEGEEPVGIQSRAVEWIRLSNLALWIAKPSKICFDLLVHCEFGRKEWRWRQIRQPLSLLCHQNDTSSKLYEKDLEVAKTINETLVNLQRNGTLWTAIRMLWLTMQQAVWDVRYLLYWTVLEAIFGPADAREITYRLAQRIAFFIGSTPTEARKIFKIAKEGYGWRSKVVHGRRLAKLSEDNCLRLSWEAEDLIRKSLLTVLRDRNKMEKMESEDRETYLDGLVFER